MPGCRHPSGLLCFGSPGNRSMLRGAVGRVSAALCLSSVSSATFSNAATRPRPECPPNSFAPRESCRQLTLRLNPPVGCLFGVRVDSCIASVAALGHSAFGWTMPAHHPILYILCTPSNPPHHSRKAAFVAAWPPRGPLPVVCLVAICLSSNLAVYLFAPCAHVPSVARLRT